MKGFKLWVVIPVQELGTIQLVYWIQSDLEKGRGPEGSKTARRADCRVGGLYLQPKSSQDDVELDFEYHGGSDWLISPE